MIRKHIKKNLEWLHVVLILSMLAPVIYMADWQMDPEQIYRMYFAGYLLIVPVIGLMKAEKEKDNSSIIRSTTKYPKINSQTS